MAKKITDDQIKWILDLDAKGVQGELTQLSSLTQKFKDENKLLEAELKAVTKQLKEAEKDMNKLAAAGDTTSDKYKEVEKTYKGASAEADSYRKRIRENTKAIEQNSKKHDDIIKSMRIENMTMEQLEKRAKSLETALKKTSEAADPKQYNKLKKELTEVRSRMGELDNGLDKTSSSFSIKGAGAALKFAAALAIAKQGFELFENIMLSNRATGIEFQSTMDGVNNALDYMKTALANLDFTNFIENLKEAHRVGKEVSIMLEDIYDRENSFKLTSSKELAKIEELKTKLRDVNLTHAERIKIGEQVKEKTKALSDEEQKINSLRLDAAKKLLVNQTQMTDAEIEYMVVNRNANDQEIQDMKKIKELEEDLIHLRGVREKYTTYSNDGKNDYYVKELEKVNSEIKQYETTMDKIKVKYGFTNEEQYKLAYDATKKYFLADKEVVDNYDNSRLRMNEVDIKTKKGLRETQRVIDSLTKRESKSIEQEQRKDLQTQLTNQENAHKVELQLLEDIRIKERKTDEEHKIAVAKSDKKYYDERVKLLQNFRKKVSDTKFKADIDTQIVDSTGKLKSQDTVVDKANIAAATKNRDELLQVEQVGTNELKRIQAERDEIAQVAALRQRTLDLSSAQNRLEILRQYSKDIQELEIADAQEKERLVREANDAVIKAETETIEKRKSLDGLYKNTNDTVRNQYGMVSSSEQQQNEKAVIDALYKEKLISEETHQQAVLAIEQKYADLKLQVKQQYGIASTAEIYEAELELLKQKLEQELLTQEEFERAKSQLQLDYATKAAQKINQLTQTAANTGNAIQQAATANLEAQYQERIAAAEGNAAEQQRLEEELAEKKLELEKKFADVQFAIKASEIISSTAVAIMVAYKQLGPVAGSIAGVMIGIAGAAQLVAANAERKKVKALTLKGSGSSGSKSNAQVVKGKGLADGGYNDAGITGGYTGDGGRYEVKGSFPNGVQYHAGEYVVAQPEMRIPAVASMVKTIEGVRRKRTNANALPNGLADGGYNDPDFDFNNPYIIQDEESRAIQRETLEVLKYLKENKIQAQTFIGMSELSAKQAAYAEEQNRYSWSKKQ